MTVIADRFAQLRSQQHCALIPFVTAGDPDLETTEQALLTLDRAGADFIELGVPYSDPLADGPVIQAAATRALQRGTRFNQVLDLVQRVSPQIQAPLILFSYYNPILHQGLTVFLDRIAEAGVKGLVVPDLPLEESDPLLEGAAARGIDLILLVAPTSSLDRMKAIAAKSQGFIYLVSVTGVTGVRQAMSDRVQTILQQLREVTDKPIGVGFGISQPEHARQVKAWGADAVIVGSAIVKRLGNPNSSKALEEIASFCQSLKGAIA
ncbi:MAG: tryptophan synthase subunit alpha [Prochlorotrichaceae cyanobacterium]|jgi:tryptophan synthase alpha chain